MVDLDTKLLRAFVAVAQELSFTRAAEQLHLTQQALSAQVRQLEDRVGTPLFERTTRRVALTAAGEAFLPSARATLDAAQAATDAARRAGGAGGTLAVALFPLASTDLGGRILRRFGETHPEITLDVGTLGMPDAVAALRAGRAHVAFVRPPFASEGISMVTILTEPRLAAVAADHPLAAQDPIDSGALAREPQVWVEGTDAVQADFWSLAEHRGDAPLRIGARMTSFDSFFEVVSAGLAVGCCPASAAQTLQPAFPGVRLLSIAGIAPCTVAVAWPTAHETPAVRAFVQTALAVSATTGH
jgi:DNA-binding transcriptional LysR family regulator